MRNAADELRQLPASSPWAESHRLITTAESGEMAMAMQVSIQVLHSHHSASFHCVVFRFQRPPIVIAEIEIVAPSALWEFRTSGLWADTICETPFKHWSYGLEAFGLEIEDPEELLGRGYGDRVPLGWELEFEGIPADVEPIAGTAASDAGQAADGSAVLGYGQRGEVHGLMLFGGGDTEFAGPAVRQHWWGRADVAGLGPVAAGLDDHVQHVLGPSVAADAEVRAEVALPLATTDGDVAQWWLADSGRSLRSRTLFS